MNQRKVGALLSYVSFFISNIIGLIYTPYMLQLMGQSEYGLHGTASSMLSYLSLLSFGVGGAYIRYNARCRASNDIDGERMLNGTFILMFSAMAVLVLICGSLMVFFSEYLVEDTFTDQETRRLRTIMIVGIISTILTFLLNTVMMSIIAYEKFIFLRVVHLVTSIVTPVVNLITLHAGGKAVALSVVTLSISIACYIVYIAYAWRVLKFRFTFRGIQPALFKEILIFSSFLFLGSITDQINNATDNIILGAVSGTTAVAIYAVGAHFRTYFLNFSTAISAVFTQRVHTIVATNGSDPELDQVFQRVGRIQFYILSLILIGYISIGHDFICIWAGPDYSDSYLIGLMLMLAVYIPLFQNVGLEIQKAKNKHKVRSIVYLIIAISNVLLTIPMAKYWGGIGAAFTTMVCMIIGNALFMNWYYARHIGLDIVGFWKTIASILPGFLIPVTVGFTINRFWQLDSYSDILISIVLITSSYCASIWFFSMNPYEKQLILQPMKNFLRRKR